MLLPGAGWAKMPMGLGRHRYFYCFKLSNVECAVVIESRVRMMDMLAVNRVPPLAY